VSSSTTAAPPREAGARYFAWLYSPAAARDGTRALLAIEREILASTREGLDHSVAHARLGWWQEEAGRLHAALPAHPAGIELRNQFLAAGLSPPDLGALPRLAARELARRALGRGPAPADELAVDAALWADGLLCPLAMLALRSAEDTAPVAALGRALYAFDRAPLAPARAALENALHALPAPLRPGLRGAIVWATLALRHSRAAGAPREAFAENWTAWRAARRATRGRT